MTKPTTDQLPLFGDPAEAALAERRRIFAERLAELNTSRIYPPAMEPNTN